MAAEDGPAGMLREQGWLRANRAKTSIDNAGLRDSISFAGAMQVVTVKEPPTIASLPVYTLGATVDFSLGNRNFRDRGKIGGL